MRNRRRWIVLALAAVLVVVLFVLLRPDDENETSAPTTTGSATTNTTPTTTPPPATATIRVDVEDGKVVGGPQMHRVPYRSQVTIVVASDVDDEVHLHGYDIRRRVEAGSLVRFAVRTTLSGRFEFELEKSHLPLGSLEILP